MSKCQDETYLEEVPTQELEIQSKSKNEKSPKKIRYKGFTVNHRFNSTENDLKEKHTKKYLKKLYNKLRKKGKSKTSFSKTVLEELELPGYEAILEASKVVLVQFPY